MPEGAEDMRPLVELSTVLKALANPTRLAILALCAEREMTSRELRERLRISKPLLIAHIRILMGGAC